MSRSAALALFAVFHHSFYVLELAPQSAFPESEVNNVRCNDHPDCRECKEYEQKVAFHDELSPLECVRPAPQSLHFPAGAFVIHSEQQDRHGEQNHREHTPIQRGFHCRIHVPATGAEA